MTRYLWDASHYDGLLSTAILTTAKAEGIDALTHKVGEGTSYDDPNDKTALAAGRDAGIELLAGYCVVRSMPVKDQVDYWISLADRDEPWWRDFPGWAWQIDLERWSYDNVPAQTGIDAGHMLQDRTGRPALMYASHGQYPDIAWDGPLWNADYTSRAAAGFAAMYPGDNWQPLHSGSWYGGWAPYGTPKRKPAILQYTSSATIAGLTTCDANGFVGTYAQLKDLWTGGTVALTDDDVTKLLNAAVPAKSPGMDTRPLKTVLADIWLALTSGQLTGGALWPSSPLVKLLTAAGQPVDVTLADAQITALAEQIGQHLVVNPDTPLGDADKPAIVEAVKQALREGNG